MSRHVSFEEVLRLLLRDELKQVCVALGLEANAREKDALIQRILGAAESARTREVVSTSQRRARTAGSIGTRATAGGAGPTSDYRHEDKRKNNPPAGIDFDRPPAQPTRTYAYDPHLDPQLQWAGKAEHTSLEIDTVSLHIHERISTQAIMRAVKREEAQRSLFGEDDLPESQAIDFYQHEVGWANRLILGDSLL